MGLYDEVRCAYPLPKDQAKFQDCLFETKSLQSVMGNYEIRADGTLWYEDSDREWVSDPTNTLFGGNFIIKNIRWVPEKLTGEVRMYTDINDEWAEFSIYFVDGKLNQIHYLKEVSDYFTGLNNEPPEKVDKEKVAERVVHAGETTKNLKEI